MAGGEGVVGRTGHAHSLISQGPNRQSRPPSRVGDDAEVAGALPNRTIDSLRTLIVKTYMHRRVALLEPISVRLKEVDARRIDGGDNNFSLELLVDLGDPTSEIVVAFDQSSSLAGEELSGWSESRGADPAIQEQGPELLLQLVDPLAYSGLCYAMEHCSTAEAAQARDI